jgi:hypothetical protein
MDSEILERRRQVRILISKSDPKTRSIFFPRAFFKHSPFPRRSPEPIQLEFWFVFFSSTLYFQGMFLIFK